MEIYSRVYEWRCIWMPVDLNVWVFLFIKCVHWWRCNCVSVDSDILACRSKCFSLFVNGDLFVCLSTEMLLCVCKKRCTGMSADGDILVCLLMKMFQWARWWRYISVSIDRNVFICVSFNVTPATLHYFDNGPN